MIFLVIGLAALAVIVVIVWGEMYIAEGRSRKTKINKGVLCYLIRDTKDGGLEICLAWKERTKNAVKRGLADKRNGYGGGLESKDSSLSACALRELFEESHVIATPEQIVEIGRVTFHNGTDSMYECTYFIVRVPDPKPLPTVEMSDPVWFSVDKLPYNDMMPSDRLIMPLVVRGKQFEADIYYDSNMNLVGQTIQMSP